METGKPLLPIFCDIKPSELRVGERRVQRSSVEQAKKWADALEEAKGITGLRFNSHTGNWSKLGRETVQAVEMLFCPLREDM
ncbi:hypothetical protein MLD38_039760 [Melastoma candidum]|uniref:Uncharacterized protein n=1 Tax=Melastoma candidum TaxID=119954 RepID=A0ACB9L492_9MYRT|nr:hypothetical protein MLD38_039760 [Melastoma candidum]